MATPRSGPARKLVELLETLPAVDRQEITAWLLGTGRNPAGASFSAPLRMTWPSEPVPRLGTALPAGEESQLVTIRLPAERHAQLRTWCTEHGFTMAAVVRGLVERFLEEQEPPAKAD